MLPPIIYIVGDLFDKFDKFVNEYHVYSYKKFIKLRKTLLNVDCQIEVGQGLSGSQIKLLKQLIPENKILNPPGFNQICDKSWFINRRLPMF